jgi:hypothetical protein
LAQDPVFLGDPKQQNLQNPQSLNSYSYADDNPITGKDPDGLALTAAQNSQLNVIKAQLLGIQAQLSSLSGNACLSGCHPHLSTNGISNVPGGNDPVGGNMMLTALSLTPGVGELGPDEILIGGRVFQFSIQEKSGRGLDLIMGRQVLRILTARRKERSTQRLFRSSWEQLPLHMWCLLNSMAAVHTLKSQISQI